MFIELIINLIIIISLINLIINQIINDKSFKEALKNKKQYEKSDLINNNNMFNFISKDTKLFFSENKNKYFELSEVPNSSITYNEIINNSSFYEIPETIISQYEKKYQREKISKIVRTIERNKNKINVNNFNQNNKKESSKNNNNEYFSDEYNFYGNKKLLNTDYSYYWNKLISKNSVINELSTSPIKELISTEPEQIYIEQKICFPVARLFYINNPDSEDNLLIKDIKSDLHQVKIFPYLPENNIKLKESQSYSISSYFPLSIFPQSKFVFQLLILPDVLDKVSGNLYIKFNDKKVLIIPITIIGIENEYKIKPIYYMNWQINNKLVLPIKITNPHKKKLLMVKDIIHSLNKINLEWPNGIKVSNNHTTYTSSMFHIWPKDSKVILYLKYISDVVTNEYGFIHLRLDDNIIIVIPVLINVKNYSLNTFPGFINFGLCDLSSHNRQNFIKKVPLLIMNYGSEDIEIKRIYIDYEDKFLHFHKRNKKENAEKIIVKKNTHNQFGYIIFDGEYAKDKNPKKYGGKIQRGSIYIETNSTIDPLLEIEYFYLADYNKILKIISGDVQNILKKDINYNFNILFKYEPPIGFQSTFNHLSQNMTVYREHNLQVNLSKVYQKNYFTDKIIPEDNYLFKFNIEIKNLDNYYHRYIFIPFMIDPRLYVIFPIELDNNNIDLVFCNSNSDENSFLLCIRANGGLKKYNNFKIQYLLISTQFHLGTITGEINQKKYFYLINDNLSPIHINNIEINNKNFMLDLEDFYSIDRNQSIMPKYDYSLKGKLPEIINKHRKYKNNIDGLNIIINPKTALLLSINIKTPNRKNKTLLEGDIFLAFNNQSGITISSKINVLIGDFSISPSNIKFDPAFPGLVQSKIIFCRNSYQKPLDIISVTSSDERIVPILLANKVEPGNKISIIEIYYKPDMNSLIKDYLPEIDMHKSLTYKDLFLWKKNEEYWNELGKNGKTEINANISVVTSLKKKIINVRTFLIKPNLVKKEEIDYGLIQVGKVVEKYIEGYNPSDSVLEIKLFLAPDYYNDIDNYSMFNVKEQNLNFDKNNNLILLGCSFIVNQNNTYKNFFEYIIVHENLDLENYSNNSMSKEELLKKLFYYGNSRVKKYLYNSVNILCHYEKNSNGIYSINKNIENKRLISELFSSEFSNEIEIIQNMTSNKDYNSNLYSLNNSILGIFVKAFSKIFNYFFDKKDYLPNLQIKENKQSFFLHENLSKNIYRIQPHQKFTIGPIIFKPNNKAKISNVLFLKNNLTILYPIKIKGEGGSGQITFINYYKDTKNKKTEIFNTNFNIEINRDIYENQMKYQNNLTRTITINNSGNLPLIIKNVTIDNNECQANDLKILKCKEFLLDIGESIDIDFEITIDFGVSITNRIVKFNTEYQTFDLNVIIIISKDLFEQKTLFWNILKILSLVFIPLLITAIIFKKYFILNKDIETKKEIKKINNNNLSEKRQIIKNEKNLIQNEQKKNYGKKKGKNKKNKKYEKIENEIEDTSKSEKKIGLDKYFKKPSDKKIEKIEKPEIPTRDKTFGVLVLKDINQNNINTKKEKREVVYNENKNLIKKDSLQKIKEKSESKDKKSKKIIQKIIDNKIINEKIDLKRKDSNNEGNADYQNKNDLNENISNKINNNINNIINSNNNIINNINIKININLNSKVEEDSDSSHNYNKNNIIEKNNTKIIEANIIHKNIPNNSNNNYNYDIKINNDDSKSSSSTNNIKVRPKKPTTKKSKVKKVSNLNELLGVTPKKKEIKKIQEKPKKIETKEDNTNSMDSFEQDILNINKDKMNESKEDYEKLISNESLSDNIKSKNEEETKDINLNEEETKNINLNEEIFDDFKLASTDIFNSKFNKDSKESNEEEIIGEKDFNGDAQLDLYEYPFCTKGKIGKLDELLKK